MSLDQFVVLGVAHARSAWFVDVARWATSGAIPVEFVKALSIEEVEARLASGRQFSALLADAHLTALDRDVVDRARSAGCAVIVVDDGRTSRAWTQLGAAAAVQPDLGRDELVELLRRVARPIARTSANPLVPERRAPSSAWRGRSIAVCGPGGVGTSTLAIATAQGLAAESHERGMVVLADLALDAEHAMLHDARDVIPGVLELVEAHRAGVPSLDEVRNLTFDVVERGYRLLLGLRRHRDWAAVRPRAFEASLDAMQRAFHYVVADVDADVEGERECGSVDVEDRNHIARTALRQADLVVVVGTPGMKGVHAHVRVVRDLIGFGVEPDRILAVVNRAPRAPRARAEVTAAFTRLVYAATASNVAATIHIAERRGLDDSLRDTTKLPDAVVRPVTAAVRTVLGRVAPNSSGTTRVPVRVAPGSLGSWSDGEELRA